MKWVEKLTDERFAKPAARWVKWICYSVMGFYILCMILSAMGRQTFSLHTGNGFFERAIYAEENHDPDFRNMTVSLKDGIHVWADSGRVNWTTHIGLSCLYAVHVIPMILAFWCLGRVFSNIQEGQIFTEQNALYLLYYGLLQVFTAIVVPFLKLLLCGLTNLVSDDRISLSTGQDTINILVPGVAFIVAAYIIRYGVHLQDEVDHTL